MTRRRRWPRGRSTVRGRLIPWAWIGLAAVFLANGARLRGRLQGLAAVAPTDGPIDLTHHFLVAEGVVLDQATRRAASAHAWLTGVAVLDLVPGDLTVERTLDLARMVDPQATRDDPLTIGRSAGHATLVDDDVMRRMSAGSMADVDLTVPLDPAAHVRVAETLKRYAPRSTAFAVAPGLSATPDTAAGRRQAIQAMYGDAGQDCRCRRRPPVRRGRLGPALTTALLDTHVVYWWSAEPDRCPRRSPAIPPIGWSIPRPSVW